MQQKVTSPSTVFAIPATDTVKCSRTVAAASPLNTPPSTMQWTHNPLWNSLVRDNKTDPESHSTPRREIHILGRNSREATPTHQPTQVAISPVMVDTSELDIVLSELDPLPATTATAPDSFNYAYSSQQQDMQPTSSISSQVSPPAFGMSPDWVMDHDAAPDDTLIKPSKMRESLRRKHGATNRNATAPNDVNAFKHDSESVFASSAFKRDNESAFKHQGENVLAQNGESRFKRGTPQRTSAREMSAVSSHVGAPERMSLRGTRSWRSAEPEVAPDAKSTQSVIISNGHGGIGVRRSNRRHVMRRVTVDTSSDDDSVAETNNNYKSSVSMASSLSAPVPPYPEYPTLYDNYPRPSKQKEGVRGPRRHTVEAAIGVQNVSNGGVGGGVCGTFYRCCWLLVAM